MKLLFISGILVLFLASCKHTESFFTYQTEAGGNQITYIDLNKVKDSVPVSLSSISSSMRIVRLQTNDSCLIGYANYYVGDKYIVTVSDVDGKILLFDANGKYIRMLSQLGRGPGEFSGVTKCHFNSSESILYGIDRNLFKLHSWTLPDGTYHSIPMAQEDRSYTFLLKDDTTVVIGNIKGEGTPYTVHTQNLEGQFIAGLANPDETVDYTAFSTNTLHNAEGKIYYMPHHCDSLYLYTGNALILKYVFPLPQKHELELQSLRNGVMLYKLFNITASEDKVSPDGIIMRRVDGIYNYYLIDPKAEEITLLRPWRNDYLNLPLDPRSISFQDDGQYIIHYAANKLLAKISETLKDKQLSPEVRQRLEELQKNMTEEDNPVLLIGKTKDYFLK